MSDTLLSRFLRYVQIDTQSDETSKTFPSTSGQLVLLEMLKQELSELGAADVQMTRHGYVLASIPANTRKARVPTVAFLAHVDTAPDCSGKNVKPIVHRKYDGRVMKFPDKPGLTLDPATSPELRTAIGKDIVTASGTTLLGSDDKSGVAVIMTLVDGCSGRQNGNTDSFEFASRPMKRSAVVWTNSICACSEPMLLTRWTAVRQGRFAGKPFLAMRPKSSSMASLRIRWRQRPKGW
jgi:Di- and tripeptidases